MSEVDAAVAAARQSWARITQVDAPAFDPRPARRPGALKARLIRMVAAVAAILVGFTIVGMVMPVGIMGALLLMAMLVAAVGGLAIWPHDDAPAAPPPPEKLRTVDLKTLPAQTGRWLGAQRSALPVPARGVADRIGQRLEVLSPQLGTVDADSESALELRRLIGEQLPAFVADYARVPAPLRAVERNGRTPDRELTDGLALIEREIAAMPERLAQGDLDSLATRGRYLEMKYRGEE